MINDTREQEHFKTHTSLVTARDKFMSGWGHAENGFSRVAWACKPEHINAVYRWVSSRKEMIYVNRYPNGEKWRPRNFAHLSIYVVDENHPALTGA